MGRNGRGRHWAIENDASTGGPYSVTVTATDFDDSGDPTGTSVDASFDWTVNNPPPVAANDTDTTDEDTSINRNAANGVIDPNDIDPDASDMLEVDQVGGDGGNVGTAIAGDNGGQFTISGSGSYEFDPGTDFDDLAGGESRDTSISYQVADGNGGTDTATLTVTVNGANDPPVAADDTDSTTENASTSGDVLANDTDPENDVLNVTQVNGTAGNVGNATVGDNGGEFTIDADGNYEFDPDGKFEDLAEGESTTTSVPYQVADGNGGTDTATLTVTVNGVNDAPVANDDTVSATEDTPTTYGPADLVDPNDTDVDGDSLNITAVNNATNGTIMLNGDGTVNFTPASDFNGMASFDYTISDGNGGSDTATVTVNVGAVNDAPDAADDTDMTDEDTAISRDAANGVIPNDTDVDGDSLNVTEVADATGNVGNATTGDNGGSFNITTNGSYEFDPDGDFDDLADGESETTSVTYNVSDDSGGTDTSTLVATAAFSAPRAAFSRKSWTIFRCVFQLS